MHNEYYGGDKRRRETLRASVTKVRAELASLEKENGGASAPPGAPPALTDGWAEARTPDGQLYYCHGESGKTSWSMPAKAGAGGANGSASAQKRAELTSLQVRGGLLYK